MTYSGRKLSENVLTGKEKGALHPLSIIAQFGIFKIMKNQGEH